MSDVRVVEHPPIGSVLRRSYDHCRAVLAHFPAIVRVIGRDGTYLLSEGRALAMIGRTPGDLVGQSIFDVQRNRPDILADIRRALAGEEICTVRELNGIVWEARYTPLREQQEVVGTLYVAMDITARARAEAAVRASEARLHDILDHASELIQIVGADDSFSYVNRAWCATLGYDLTGTPHLTMRDIVAPEVWSQYRMLVARLLSGDDLGTIELTLLARDGRRIAVEGQMNQRLEAGQPPLLRGIFRDVSRQKDLEANLVHQATHDSLTGVPNRALFLQRLEAAATRSAPSGATIAVFFIDLDGFKEVNDRLGHAAGDIVLAVTARRLQDCAGQGATVGRLGGDEFALLLDVADEVADDERAVTQLAESIMATLALPVVVGGARTRVRASIGIALGRSGCQSADALLTMADTLMYRAKRGGPGRYLIASLDPVAAD